MCKKFQRINEGKEKHENLPVSHREKARLVDVTPANGIAFSSFCNHFHGLFSGEL